MRTLEAEASLLGPPCLGCCAQVWDECEEEDPLVRRHSGHLQQRSHRSVAALQLPSWNPAPAGGGPVEGPLGVGSVAFSGSALTRCVLLAQLGLVWAKYVLTGAGGGRG